MAAHHFFIGIGAGVALLGIPMLVLGPQAIVELPQRFSSWIDGPPPQPTAVIALDINRPRRGTLPGDATPNPTNDTLPVLNPVQLPTSLPLPTPTLGLAPVAPLPVPGSGLRSGVVSTNGAGVQVRRAIGVDSPSDPVLPDGSPVLVGGSIRIANQDWESIRGLNGIAGWVPTSAVAVDGATGPGPTVIQGRPTPITLGQGTPVSFAERVMIANTSGAGVVLRASPRLEDRTTTAVAEGALVTVLERSGSDWLRVHVDSGQDGWVPSQYVQPVS